MTTHGNNTSWFVLGVSVVVVNIENWVGSV